MRVSWGAGVICALTCLLGLPKAAAAEPWAREGAPLRAPKPAEWTYFANTACISGNIAIFIGFHNGDHKSVADPALVFERRSTGWGYSAALPTEGSWRCALAGKTALFSGNHALRTFEQTNTGWLESAPALPFPDSQFESNALDLSGDRVIVGDRFDRETFGSPGANPERKAGAVFVRSGPGWTQEGPALTTPDADNDMLGYTVAISNDTAIVTSVSRWSPGTTAGAVTMFARSGATWIQQGPSLGDPSLQAPDQFGVSADVFENTVVVAARRATPDDGSASAYVFVRSGGNWAQQGPALTVPARFEQSGEPLVKLWGDTLVFIADGAGRIFTRTSGVWSQQGEAFIATEPDASPGYRLQATTLDLDEHEFVVGYPGANFPGSPRLTAAGSATIYTDGTIPPVLAEAGAGGAAGDDVEAGGTGGIGIGAAGDDSFAGTSSSDGGASDEQTSGGTGAGGKPPSGGTVGSAGADSDGGRPATMAVERSAACNCRVGSAPPATQRLVFVGLAALAVLGGSRRRTSRARR